MWEQAPRGRNSPDLKKWRLITSCQSWITHHIHSTLNQPTNRHPSPPNMQAPLSLPLSLPPPSPPRSPPSLPPTYNKVTPIRSPPQPKLKEGKGEEGGTPRRREGGLLDLKMVESWERTREFGDPERSERASLTSFSSLFFPARCFFRVSSGKLLCCSWEVKRLVRWNAPRTVPVRGRPTSFLPIPCFLLSTHPRSLLSRWLGSKVSS